ncbi:micrococcal nuclease [Gammaproteobacteria bacterium]
MYYHFSFMVLKMTLQQNIISILILFFSIILYSHADDSYRATVIDVHDGDTITIDVNGKQSKVRLSKIDAPELKQDVGVSSQRFLSKLILGKSVWINEENTDIHGRILASIKTSRGLDVGLEQVKKGFAWVYRRYSRDPLFVDAEDSAQARRIGLWSNDKPIPPWEFRNKVNNSIKKE